MKRILIRLLGAVVLLSTCLSSMAEDDYRILIHEDAGVTELSSTELYYIYTFRQSRWENGTPITVVLFPLNSPESRYFIEHYLNVTNIGYARRLRNRIATGRSHAPVIAETYTEMLKELSGTSGSIGSVADIQNIIPDHYHLTEANVVETQSFLVDFFGDHEE